MRTIPTFKVVLVCSATFLLVATRWQNTSLFGVAGNAAEFLQPATPPGLRLTPNPGSELEAGVHFRPGFRTNLPAFYPIEAPALNTWMVWGNVKLLSGIRQTTVEEGPDWTPADPLPLSFSRAEKVGREQLNALVEDERNWEMNGIQLQRSALEASKSKWTCRIEFQSKTSRWGWGATAFYAYVGLSGQPGILGVLLPDVQPSATNIGQFRTPTNEPPSTRLPPLPPPSGQAAPWSSRFGKESPVEYFDLRPGVLTNLPAPPRAGAAFRAQMPLRNFELQTGMLRKMVESAPNWSLGDSLPVSPGMAERVARKQLNGLVIDEPTWELVKIELWRLPNDEGMTWTPLPRKWFYQLEFHPGQGSTSHGGWNTFFAYVDLSGRPGFLAVKPRPPQ
jgi:hypothetical protein